MWADHIERDLTAANLFAIQDDIARRVSATVAGIKGIILTEMTRDRREISPAGLVA